MDRRRFIRQVMFFCAGYRLLVPRFFPGKAAAAMAASDLVSVTGSDYGALVREADAARLAVSTHRVLVELALEAGAREVRIFDNTCNEKRRCYVNSGIKDAIDSLNTRKAKLLHIDERKFVPVDIAAGRSLTRWEI